MEEARREKLGRKWACYSCEKRFYDLNRPEPLCPRCGADQREVPDVERAPARRKKKAVRVKKAAKKKTARKASAKKSKDPDPDDEEFDDFDSEDEVLDLDDLDLLGDSNLEVAEED